ncbi:MAG: T9SS type A sorting domain-containing protein [candidate division Zixibacteria bacterium]|nr:T9SS type A sorting domain-containing protein [candidate division Zixibacteria bacterium]
MRRLLAVIGIVLLASTAIAAERVQLQPMDGFVNTEVLESSDSRIVVRFDIGAFTREAVQINGDTYYNIECGKESILMEKGNPALPRICRSVIIPDDARMEVNVVSSEYKDFAGLAVVPSKGNLYRDVNPEDVPYEFGDIYNRDQWYRGDIAMIREPFILRDLRGTVIELNAFRYNPALQTLRVYTSVTVELVNAGPGQANVLQRDEPFTSVVSEFNQIYKRRFLNYQETMTLYNPVEETGSMLVITYDSYADEMVPFVNWKNQKGIATTMVNVSAIGNNSTAIKNYIQNLYNTSDLAFVLLVGDAQHVATPEAYWGAADPTYAKLAGGDDYPDAFIGRFSAETGTQVTTQVERTIDYELNPGGSNWFHKGTGVASDEGPGHYGEYDDEHMDLIRNDLLGYTYTTVDQIYDPGASAYEVTNALNNGRSFVNYCGHGSTTSWGTTGFDNGDVNALTNVGMLPFIVSVACVNGNFDGYTCFGEAWLRATSGGEPSGALAAYMSSINQSWNPPMDAQDEITDLLVAEQKNTFGGLCFNGSCKTIELNGGDGDEIFSTWIIFGDPSVQVRTDDPVAMNVIHDGTVHFAQSSYNVTVSGVEGALCALSYNGTLYGSEYTNSSGNAVISINGPLPIGATLDLTVTAYNRITNVSGVSVIAEGSWGTVTGRVTDSETGDGLYAEVTLINRTPQIIAHCSFDGYYTMAVPADTQWTLVAGGLAHYSNDTASVSVPEGGTETVNFQLIADEITTIFSDDFSSNQGWTGMGGSGEWTIGSAGGGYGNDNYGGPDPSTDHTPSSDNGVLGNDLTSGSGGDYSANMYSTYWVTSPTIDCSGYSEVSMKFYRWLGLERDAYDNGYLAVYDGSTWHTIWENGNTTIDDQAWIEMTYDISTYADSNANFRIRFGIGTTDGAWQYCGWNIDDLEITGYGEQEPPAPDVVVTMNPHNPPVIVNPGGYFTFTGILENTTQQYQQADVWIMLQLPGGSFYGPLNQFNNIFLSPGQTITVPTVRQDIPSFAPTGTYDYISYCGDYPSVKEDSSSFPFSVQGNVIGDVTGWTLHGWFDDQGASLPKVTKLYGNYPNPFNAQTNIRYDLAQDSKVSLLVYNLMGQVVETVLDEYQQAGEKVVSWDASRYSSGIYFYRFTAGDKTFIKQATMIK